MKKKSRHRINTGNTVRLGSRSERYSFNNKCQSVIIKYSLDNRINRHDQVKLFHKYEEAASKHVDDGGLPGNHRYSDSRWESDLMMSLNKRKRWLLRDMIVHEIDCMKNTADGTGEEAFKLVLTERQLMGCSRTYANVPSHDCVGYHDSSLDSLHIKPKGTFSFFTDLRSSGQQHGEAMERLKKNRKHYPSVHQRGVQRKYLRGKRSSSRSDQRRDSFINLGNNEDVPEVRYEVCAPKPLSGHPSMCTRNTRWKELYYYNCRKHLKKLQRQGLTEEISAALDDASEISGQTKEGNWPTQETGWYRNETGWFNGDTTLPSSTVADLSELLVHSSNKNKARQRKSRKYGMRVSEEPQKRGKGCAIYVNQESESIVEPAPVVALSNKAHEPQVERAAMDPVQLFVSVASITSSHLLKQFSHNYNEGGSIPRCFALNLTSPAAESFSHFSQAAGVFCDTGEIVVVNLCEYTKLTCEIKLCIPPEKVLEMEHIWKQTTVQFHGQFHSDLQEFYDSAYYLARLITQDVIPSTNGTPAAGPSAIYQHLNIRATLFPHDGARKKVISVEGSLGARGQDSGLAPSHSSAAVEADFCGICYAAIEVTTCGSETRAMCLAQCYHWFCVECWQLHVQERIKSGDVSVQCPGHGCTEAVNAVTLRQLLPSAAYRSFMNQRCDRLLEACDRWKWCPATGCGRVVFLEEMGLCHEAAPPFVHCECKRAWCWLCQEPPHWPASCQQARHYRNILKQRGDDSIRNTTSDFCFYVPTKSCPHCRYPIEKNMGCQHMTCTICKMHFCWECLFPWEMHSGAICPRLKVEEKIVEINSSDDVVHMREVFYQKAVTHRKSHLAMTSTSLTRQAREMSMRMKRHGVELPWCTHLLWMREHLLSGHLPHHPHLAILILIKQVHVVLECIFMKLGSSKRRPVRSRLSTSADILTHLISHLHQMLCWISRRELMLTASHTGQMVAHIHTHLQLVAKFSHQIMKL